MGPKAHFLKHISFQLNFLLLFNHKLLSSDFNLVLQSSSIHEPPRFPHRHDVLFPHIICYGLIVVQIVNFLLDLSLVFSLLLLSVLIPLLKKEGLVLPTGLECGFFLTKLLICHLLIVVSDSLLKLSVRLLVLRKLPKASLRLFLEVGSNARVILLLDRFFEAWYQFKVIETFEPTHLMISIFETRLFNASWAEVTLLVCRFCWYSSGLYPTP